MKSFIGLTARIIGSLSSRGRRHHELVEVPVGILEVDAARAAERIVRAPVRRVLGIVAERDVALAQAGDRCGERLGRDPDREVEQRGAVAWCVGSATCMA
jgi:CBS domain-containing protein